jgi:hypothetical protein
MIIEKFEILDNYINISLIVKENYYYHNCVSYGLYQAI